ncbi:MAG: ComEC/Rec2 family competence protein, partial [candidate division WOR-3 bacterium]
MRWAGMRAFAAIALGIALQAWASIPLWLLLMGLGLVLAAESLTWSHKDSIQSRSSRGRRSIQAVGVCRILLLFGLSLAGAVSYASRTGLYLRLPFLRHVRATGTVMSEPLPVQGIRSYEFRLDSIEVAGQKFPAGLKVRFSSGRYFRYGSRLCVVGDIAPFHYPRNPGLIDLNTYYQRQGFVGMVRAYDLVRVLPGVGGCAPIREVVMPLRRHFVGTVGRYFVGKERGLLAGLLLGEGGDLSPETREEFVRSGLAHILAVSGLNVSIVVGVCVLVLSLLGIRDRLAFACTTVMTLLYVAITGWSASAARAGLMAILASIGLAFERRYDPLNGVCVAGIVLLLLDPLVVFDPGFQLSFAATAGIVAFLPLARPTIRRLVPNRRVRGWLVWPVAVVLVAQLCAFPLTLYYFHQVSLVAWLANLVAMPFVTLATPLGLLLVAVAPFSSHIAQLLANTLGLVTSGIIRLTEQFGSADWAMIVTGQPKLWIVVWLYCLVALLVAIRQRWAQRALVGIALGGLGLLVWGNALRSDQPVII